MLPYHYELCLLEINFKFTGDKKRTLSLMERNSDRQKIDNLVHSNINMINSVQHVEFKKETKRMH